MFRFVKTTAAGGIVFILPLLLILILVEKGIHILEGPALKLMPMIAGKSVAGVTVFTLVALVFIVLICFFAGLAAKTQMASSLLGFLEEHILGKLPGYLLLKDAASQMTGLENLDGARVGLISEDDGWLFCLVPEQQAHGWLTVYIPDAGPGGGTAGELRLFPEAKVLITELAWLPVLACLRRGGRGALNLALPWLPKQETPSPE